MKKRWIISIIAVISSLLFLVWLKANNKKEVFQDFIGELNKTREEFINNSEPVDLSKYAVRYEDEEAALSDEELELLSTITESSNGYILYEEAKEDIDYAFKLLKYNYGAYEYFGGDEVFNKSKEEVLNSLSKEEKISRDTVSLALFNGLETIITDGHFNIDGFNINMKKNLTNSFSKEHYFSKDGDRYYTLINNEKYYLEEVDGSKDIEIFMKQSIDLEGNLTYVIGVTVGVAKSYSSIEIRLVNKENKVINKNISMSKNLLEYDNGKMAYEEYERNGIKILDINSMSPTTPQDESLNLFMESGEKYADEPLLIIDLRGNGGGNQAYSAKWFTDYLDKEFFQPTQSYILRDTKFNLINIIKRFEEIENIQPAEKSVLNQAKNELENGEYGTWIMGNPKSEFIENDNLIFVLIDKGVASSGEGFIDYLRYKENVVLVGGNTAGVSLVIDSMPCQLPNSKVIMNFGKGVVIGAEGDNLDGKGFEPDIWVNSSEALDLTLSLIENYKLK
ncbi:S41 family peptidase [Clostridium sp. B9]|uniref:S41 family peptidase n=1 Tax=Clostridium sp. B9 TaxID=3423224 RepID=UPI003D2EF10F